MVWWQHHAHPGRNQPDSWPPIASCVLLVGPTHTKKTHSARTGHSGQFRELGRGRNCADIVVPFGSFDLATP